VTARSVREDRGPNSQRIKTVSGILSDTPALSGYNTTKLSRVPSFKPAVRKRILLISVELTWDGRSKADAPLIQSTMTSL